MSDLNVDCVSVICSFLDINTDEHVLDAFSLQGKERERVLNYWKSHSEYKIIEEQGIKEWYRNGKLHRDGDLPAVECVNGTKEWYRNGKLHREGDLPAVVCQCNEHSIYKFWYRNGELHREGDLPAIEWPNGTKYWYKNGELHREGDLPALEYSTGRKEWYRNGLRYREYNLPVVE